MNIKLTLEALEVLDAIDRKGSFAAAAGALYKVPSAITYTMNKLEEDLGVILFRREGRRSILTPAGLNLLDQGRDLLTAAERLVETTRRIDTGWESCLNITIDSILNMNCIHPLLEKFYQLNPDIEINLNEEVLGGSWESILEGRADLVLGANEHLVNTRGLCIDEIGRVEWQLVVAKNHPLTLTKGPVTEEEIQRYRAIVGRDSSRERPPLTRRLGDKQAKLTVSTMQQKIDCQMAGLGVGFLPMHRISKQLASGQLVVLPTENKEAMTPICLIWKSNNKGIALRWFIEQLKENFQL